MSNPLISLGERARAAAQVIAQAHKSQKDKALGTIREVLQASEAALLAANELDIQSALKRGMSEALVDRLRLNASRLKSIYDSLDVIQTLPDPIDRLLESTLRPNGLRIEKRSVPLGVIGIIFESRPNVAVDAAALCIKSGNACILRGSSDSWNSVQLIVTLIGQALDKVGLPQDIVQTLPSEDRALVGSLLTLENYVDVIIPRGGKSLISRVRAESRIPVFSHLDGICHTYIDKDADVTKAITIVVNAKMRRPSICGATECLILHKDILQNIGKDILTTLLKAGCEVRVPSEILSLVPGLKESIAADYGFEFLAPIIAVTLVSNVKEAVQFINQFGSQHTDAIITENRENTTYFMHHVTSAIALLNASTQFADGGEFGKGAEIGIATGKLHARGPVGLEELTTYQYRVYGNGQIRP